MPADLILTNARLVLGYEVVSGTLRTAGGEIVDVDTGRSTAAGAIDCEGDFIAPGLIELHTDNLERHMTPRPGVSWPHRAAIIAHDRELAGTGITTVFDAIRVGSILSDNRKRNGRYARQMADEILECRAAGLLKVSHHLHLRAEVCSETLIDELGEFGTEDRVGIVSLMDHTPGQRQFTDLKKFEDYVCGKHGLSRTDFQDYVTFLYGLQSRFGVAHEKAAVAAATRLGATLASHDDTTAGQVATSKTYGVALAEFPTTVEAANACHSADIGVMMGAPNLVRGGSHSGNVAASDLANLDRLDILSSDYVPASLLMAAVQLGHLWGDMARGIATVTSAPAARVGLKDRGALRAGLRADIIRFAEDGGGPVVKSAWCAGQQVA